jgi:porin
VNQALVANPAFLLGLPYTSFTMGAAMPRDWGMITTFIYDPRDRTQDFFQVDDLFADGIIMGGEVKVKTNFLGMKGHQHVGGLWKHVELTDLSFAEPPPSVYPSPVVPGFATISDSYTIHDGFDQYLVQFADNPERGYGSSRELRSAMVILLHYDTFSSAGVGGFSPVIGRHRGDTFGLGWYYVGASNEFGPLPQAIFWTGRRHRSGAIPQHSG